MAPRMDAVSLLRCSWRRWNHTGLRKHADPIGVGMVQYDLAVDDLVHQQHAPHQLLIGRRYAHERPRCDAPGRVSAALARIASVYTHSAVSTAQHSLIRVRRQPHRPDRHHTFASTPGAMYPRRHPPRIMFSPVLVVPKSTSESTPSMGRQPFTLLEAAITATPRAAGT